MNDGSAAHVFLGVPAVLTASQQPVLEQWLGWLEDRALEVFRLKRTAYGQDPWPLLTGLLAQADGVILLGFRQLDTRAATWRPHTAEEAHPAGWWTSPWLHLEAGMAVMLGLPLLVAPEGGVAEGVFSPGVRSSQVLGTALSSPGKAAMQWLELVHGRRVQRVTGG
jgi:hypothetical protein